MKINSEIQQFSLFLSIHLFPHRISQNITGPDQMTYQFEINTFDKYRLLNGLDDLSITMDLNNLILKFTKVYKVRHSWAS